MTDDRPYYARYDMRYQKARKLGLRAFKMDEECVATDIALLDAFLHWRDDIGPPKRVMEFGCGDGYLAIHMAKAGYSVVAFDYSEPDHGRPTVSGRS